MRRWWKKYRFCRDRRRVQGYVVAYGFRGDATEVDVLNVMFGVWPKESQ